MTTAIDEVKEILPNGAEVLERCGSVVLCRFRGEYVTWKTDDNRNAYWGHYYQSLLPAVQDFEERAGLRSHEHK